MNLGRYIRTIVPPKRTADRPIPAPDWPRPAVTVPVRREEEDASRPEVKRACL